MTRVVVNGKYTYETDLDLEVGAKVRLPGRSDGTFDGEVTSLESTYDGPCKKILGVIKQYVGKITIKDGICRITIDDIYDETCPADESYKATHRAKKWLKERDPMAQLTFAV